MLCEAHLNIQTQLRWNENINFWVLKTKHTNLTQNNINYFSIRQCNIIYWCICVLMVRGWLNIRNCCFVLQLILLSFDVSTASFHVCNSFVVYEMRKKRKIFAFGVKQNTTLLLSPPCFSCAKWFLVILETGSMYEWDSVLMANDSEVFWKEEGPVFFIQKLRVQPLASVCLVWRGWFVV